VLAPKLWSRSYRMVRQTRHTYPLWKEAHSFDVTAASRSQSNPVAFADSRDPAPTLHNSEIVQRELEPVVDYVSGWHQASNGMAFVSGALYSELSKRPSSIGSPVCVQTCKRCKRASDRALWAGPWSRHHSEAHGHLRGLHACHDRCRKVVV